MTTARRRAEAPNYLSLVPRDPVAAIAERIRPLLEAIAVPTVVPPSNPTASPVQVGTIEQFYDIYGGGDRVAYVYHGVGGKDIIVTLPLGIDAMEAAAAVQQLVERLVG